MKLYLKLPIALSLGLLMGASATQAVELYCPKIFEFQGSNTVGYLIDNKGTQSDYKLVSPSFEGIAPGQPFKQPAGIIACKYLKPGGGAALLKSDPADDYRNCTISEDKKYFDCQEGSPKKK